MVKEEALGELGLEDLMDTEAIPKAYEDELDSRIKLEQNLELMGEIEEVSICKEDPTKTICVGKHLPPTMKENVINTVKENQDVLAWSHSNMTRIDRNTICHALNIDKDATLFRQKRRPLDPMRANVVK
uniref:Uncharacterized protein n=1 Tax=Cannabis sativa TaxID=3483 RepID=A0A803PKQ9_CANSA